ncbi:MAG: hypothetical protein JWQ29_1515 [Phenylobacterium sp.]|nr:hypothetical protein [Phenylobacterium sp.]
MDWATNRLIHFDRVASAWLIKRFIDREARFTFIEAGSEPPAGATTFAIAGGDIGRHDHEGSTFTKLIKRYALKDPVLQEVEKIVAAGVAYVTQGKAPGPDDRVGWVALGLMSVAEGTACLADSDHEILSRSLPTWDAVYMDAGIHALRTNPPGAPGDGEAMLATKFAMAFARYRQAVGGRLAEDS